MQSRRVHTGKLGSTRSQVMGEPRIVAEEVVLFLSETVKEFLMNVMS